MARTGDRKISGFGDRPGDVRGIQSPTRDPTRASAHVLAGQRPLNPSQRPRDPARMQFRAMATPVAELVARPPRRPKLSTAADVPLRVDLTLSPRCRGTTAIRSRHSYRSWCGPLRRLTVAPIVLYMFSCRSGPFRRAGAFTRDALEASSITRAQKQSATTRPN